MSYTLFYEHDIHVHKTDFAGHSNAEGYGYVLYRPCATGGSDLRHFLIVVTLLLAPAIRSIAQENPYFVTYDHHMEETGNLEISTQGTIAMQKHDLPTLVAPLLELEYGWNGWWTSELYLEGSSQMHDSAVFAGWRLENRFKVLQREHWINPVLYFEFEDVNEASHIRKEIVGHDEPVTESLSLLRQSKARELEGKLILSSNVHSWNISENFIVEKNTSSSEATEFGYAVGISRPLATMASGTDCKLCRENFRAALEFYGGLGNTEVFGLPHTAQFIAPGIVWQLNAANSLKASTAFGLTSASERTLFRVGYTYEIQGFGHKVRQMLSGKTNKGDKLN